MTETKHNTQTSPRNAPADAASPFFTFQSLWKSEMGRMLEESTAAMERSYGEIERMTQESNRMGVAGVKAMHDLTKQWMTAARTFVA